MWYRSRALTPAELMKRLPTQNALLLYVNFQALRGAGILQLLDNSKVKEDAEYLNFVHQTDFNYKRDLDSALVAFAPTGNYMLVRGRFDWKMLRNYAQQQQGWCYNSLCRMPGSTPERKISFFPLQSGLMALAVSPDEAAVVRLQASAAMPAVQTPNAPVWLSIPASMLRSGENLPSGTRMFAHTIDQAQSITLSLVQENNRLAAKLNALFRNDRDAVEAAGQLTNVTNLLRQMIEREHGKPNGADLSGVLTSGSFESKGDRVFGYWPIERSFVTNILGGD